MNESEIPVSMEQNGFTNVTPGYAVIYLTPDALKYSRDMGEAMIEAQRQTNLEAIKNAHIEGEAKVIEEVNEKYDKRIELYRAGIKQWDTSVSVTMILRGQK